MLVGLYTEKGHLAKGNVEKKRRGGGPGRNDFWGPICVGMEERYNEGEPVGNFLSFLFFRPSFWSVSVAG